MLAVILLSPALSRQRRRHHVINDDAEDIPATGRTVWTVRPDIIREVAIIYGRIGDARGAENDVAARTRR